jgi:hypothetical protein
MRETNKVAARKWSKAIVQVPASLTSLVGATAPKRSSKPPPRASERSSVVEVENMPLRTASRLMERPLTRFVHSASGNSGAFADVRIEHFAIFGSCSKTLRMQRVSVRFGDKG